jgi:hypothetical protein
VSRHSHKVLPMPVNGEDLVLRLIFWKVDTLNDVV